MGDHVVESVWGFGPKEVWAAGGGVMRWDGSSWTEVPSGSHFHRLWGLAPNDLWATSEDGMFHWDGSVWKASPGGERCGGQTGHIWGSGPNDVWVARHDQICHWNGARWTASRWEDVASRYQPGGGACAG